MLRYVIHTSCIMLTWKTITYGCLIYTCTLHRNTCPLIYVPGRTRSYKIMVRDSVCHNATFHHVRPTWNYSTCYTEVSNDSYTYVIASDHITWDAHWFFDYLTFNHVIFSDVTMCLLLKPNKPQLLVYKILHVQRYTQYLDIYKLMSINYTDLF